MRLTVMTATASESAKTVNGVEYTYEYLDGMLLYETRGEAKFYYTYDSYGYFQTGNSILDANTFAYCGNDLVNNSDPNGEHSCGDVTSPKCSKIRRDYVQTEKGT